MFKKYNRPPRVYKPKPPLKRAFQIIGAIILAAVIVSVILFFWLRQYAVYLPDGSVEIQLPWGTI
jgi:hypothetical protein